MCFCLGEVILVAQRLDARYDWLPSPHNLAHKHAHFNIAFYGNACDYQSELEESKVDEGDDYHEKRNNHKGKGSEGRIALVSPGGCSLFTKVTGLQY